MKKFYLVFILFTIIGFTIFSDNGEISGTQEEIDFLLFLPNSSSQFVDEEQAMIHLDNVARYLMSMNINPGQIRVDGYAAAAANDIDSLDLSMERALYVVNELQKRGIPDFLFTDPQAFGEVDFWGNNVNENEKIPNRRARILLSGHVLTPETMDSLDPGIDTLDFDSTRPAEGSVFPWPLLLLIIPLIAAILFIASKSRKKETLKTIPMTVDRLPADAVAVSYTTVNLEEEIRLCAYELYLERNGQNGDAYRDWCKAILLVCARYQAEGYQTYAEDGNWLAHRENNFVKT